MCLQLQSTLNEYIDINKPILFNKYIINLDKHIVYNNGYFYLNCDGIYHINWWITLNNTNSNLSFKIKSCKGHIIESCISNNSTQVFGNGLVDVTNSHLKLALINSSNAKVILSQSSNIKASISIYKISPSFNNIMLNSQYKSTIHIADK